MKAPIQWIKDFIKFDLPPEKLADRLTMAGLEVGAIEYHGKNISDVVVGKIKGMEKHATKPDILICQVDTGIKILQIVTKAQNLKIGDKVPVALHGAKLPSGIKIQNRELHGVESFGMLCSEIELGLNNKAEGILILEKDSAVGEDIRKVLGIGGAVLDIDVLPNRIDVMSISGVAREIGAVLNKKIKLPPVAIKESEEKSSAEVKITVKDKTLCPRYMARVIKNVKVKPSPEWMQERLLACGMRPINNIVDITNYVLLEMGQPLHAFDLRLIKDGHVIVRKAIKKEKVTTIDGEKRELTESLVIADPEKIIAVAGVIGAANTEVFDATKDILLESAFFEPKSIHRTEKELKVRSEASIRFDRGVDWDGVPMALDRAASLISELAGGEIMKGKFDLISKPRKPKKITIRPDKINKVLGTKLTLQEIKSVIARLGFTLKGKAVEVPLFRAGDIEREIDVIEEIARIYGYDKMPVTLPNLNIKGAQDRSESKVNRIKTILVDSGLYETINYSMLPSAGVPQVADTGGPAIRLLNPISDDLAVMRASIVPSLLKCLSYNINRQIEDVNIFEIGKVFYLDKKGARSENLELAAIMYGKRAYRYDGVKDLTDFFQVKKQVLDILGFLGANCELRAREIPGYHPQRCAEVIHDGEGIASFGELHPDVSDRAGAKGPVYALRLNLDKILNIKKLPQKFNEIPQYPASKRDIAMIIPLGVTNQAILDAIGAVRGDIVEDITLFDRYEGGQIEKGYYGLAYSITYRSFTRTLTEVEVSSKHEEISSALSDKLGIRVRK